MDHPLCDETIYVGDSVFRCDQLLWGVVVVGAAADLLSTLVGLSLCFTETNPVARATLDAGGGAGLVVLKLAALAVLFAVYRRLRPLYRRGALVAFAAPQLVAAGHNGLLVARAAGLCP